MEHMRNDVYPWKILRGKQADAIVGTSQSGRYRAIELGLFPPPVKIYGATKGYPEHELQRLVKAIIAGRTEDEIRALVAQMIAERGTAS